MRKVPRGVKIAVAVILAPTIYLLSFGPVLWLSGMRGNMGWQNLPRVARYFYAPIVWVPNKPGWYRHYLRRFIRQDDPGDGKTLEIAVSAGQKVKIRAPEGCHPALFYADDGSPVVWVLRGSDNLIITSLTFATAAGGEYTTQQAVDDLVVQEDAYLEKESKEQQVHVVEMKLESGLGAYATFSIPGFESANKVTYFSMGGGRYVSKGVVVKFTVRDDATLQQVLEFIGDGITVE